MKGSASGRTIVRRAAGAILTAAAVMVALAPQAAAGPFDVPAPGDRATTPVQLPQAPANTRGGGGESDAPAPATGVNFLATILSESGFIPPDTTGAVGNTNIVVPLNGRIKTFNKAGTVQNSVTLNDFFSSVVPSGNAFDPKVEYDALSDRWFVVALAPAGNGNSIMIATSNGPDVSAGESAYTFRAFVPGAVIPANVGKFTDYPTIGVDANSLLIGTNDFGADYDSSSLYILDKSDLIAGTLTVTGQQVGLDNGTGMFTPQPAENEDPAATESYVVGVDNGFFGRLDYRRVTYGGGAPTIGPQIQLTVPATTNTTLVPAQGSTTSVDTTNDRLFEAMVNRDPATGQARLWTAHNFEVNASGAADPSGSRVGSRWYELGNLSGTPTVVQAGTLFDSAASNPDSYFFPAIAANGQGHALLGSSVAGPARFIGVALAQRFAGEPAGTLGPVNFAQPGAASYTLNDGVGRNRWGDYSQVSLDPTDGLTWWAFQEYVSAANQWAVRVIEVGAPPPATPASSTVAAPGSASTDVTVTGASANGSAFYDPGPGSGITNRLTATVSGGVVVNSIAVNGPTQLTLNLNTTAAAIGLKNLTITNPDGQSVTANNVINVADVDPPETDITKQPKKKTDSEKATLKFESDEPGSDFECKLAGKDVKKKLKQFGPCDSGKVKYKNLQLGKKTFQVRAVDAAGNVDPTPDKAKWKVLED